MELIVLILLLVFSVPFLAFMVIWELSMIHRDRCERDGSRAKDRDDWKVM